MRKRLVLAVVLGSLAVGCAGGASERTAPSGRAAPSDVVPADWRDVDRDGFHMKVPVDWIDLPDVANHAANELLGQTTEVTGGAVALGDPKQGVFALVVWTQGKTKVADAGAEIADYQEQVRASLATEGTVVRWEPSGGGAAGSSTIRMAVDEGDRRMEGVSYADVDHEGHARAWLLQCQLIKQHEASAGLLCTRVASEFGVTRAP